ncbi:hypothetical protein L249_1483 [Ophiocordyceps polyrhachis-furcata BCC 54312]|uniref:Beta-lactamase-related domain-containing protein n=1 Tax=Ophiocordyceps polyrhachis-furcata BCC 54312 TaxID=1330021 RepID=A0A367L427_9HYPO|nr:hypothetical protein L249_1483 [Ophiocordyceps polyrhachis-furcata BCC 54312]
MKSKPSVVSVALYLAMAAGATEQRASRPSPFTDEFGQFARDSLHKYHVAGLSIAVIEGGHIFAEGYGNATLPDTPARPDTLWYVGSTTKALVAAVLGQLIDSKAYPALERGWKTPISSVIRDDFVLQDDWSTDHVTLLDAATHQSGLTAHDMSLHYSANKSRETIVRDTVRNLRNLPMHLEPHSEFHYNNQMYTALQHVVETLTGKWLGDLLKDMIWTPLEMKSSYFDLKDAQAGPEHLSTGYYWHPAQAKLKAMPLMPTDPMNASGAVISTVVDFAAWVRCLMGRTKPLSEAVHKELLKPRVVQSAEPGMGTDVTLYSLGWFRTTLYGHAAYWHSGSVDTHGALIYWFPDLDYGVVLLANYPSPVRYALMWRLIEDKLRIPKDKRFDIGDRMRREDETKQREIKNATNVLFPDRPTTPLPPSLKPEAFAGRYRNAGYGIFELRPEKDPSKPEQTMLVADRDDFEVRYQLRLQHVSGDFWVAYIESPDRAPGPSAFYRAQFNMGADGKAVSLAVTMYDRDEMVMEGVVVYERTE